MGRMHITCIFNFNAKIGANAYDNLLTKHIIVTIVVNLETFFSSSKQLNLETPKQLRANGS